MIAVAFVIGTAAGGRLWREATGQRSEGLEANPTVGSSGGLEASPTIIDASWQPGERR
jgi:hypothetical protein